MNEDQFISEDSMMVLKETGKSVLKGCFGLIPYVGAALDEVAFEYRGRVYQNRLNRFIEALADYMGSARGEDIDYSRLKSEEFGDIFESIVRRVLLTGSEEKIQRFKKILVQEMMKNTKPSDFKETYLDIVSRINENQIRILNEYRKAQESVQDESIGERGVIDGGGVVRTLPKLSPHRHAEYYDLSKSEYLFYVQDLVSKSLLVDDGMGRSGGYDPYEVLEITPFGVEFLRYIEGYN
jgi:hypothetical protein